MSNLLEVSQHHGCDLGGSESTLLPSVLDLYTCTASVAASMLVSTNKPANHTAYLDAYLAFRQFYHCKWNSLDLLLNQRIRELSAQHHLETGHSVLEIGHRLTLSSCAHCSQVRTEPDQCSRRGKNIKINREVSVLLHYLTVNDGRYIHWQRFPLRRA